MNLVLVIVLGGLLVIALRYGVVGMNGLATYRQKMPLVYWLGVLTLGVAFLAALAMVLGIL